MSATFRTALLVSAESVFSSSFFYREPAATLAELLEPGFFPAHSRLKADEVGLLQAGDGLALALVREVRLDGVPILVPALAGPLPQAAPARPAKAA